MSNPTFGLKIQIHKILDATAGTIDGMTDAKAAELVKLFGRDAARLGALTGNNMHNHEHYGNMVTYMRLKNIVPPSSEPR